MTRLTTCHICGDPRIASESPPHDPAGEECGAFMPGDWQRGPTCDRPLGHDGNHVAGDRYVDRQFSWRGTA